MGVYKKLSEVKKKVSYIQKDKESHQYKYASPSAVLSKINPLLNECGLLLKPEVIEMHTERIYLKPKMVDLWHGKEKVQEKIDVFETLFRLKMRMTWVDTETGETDVNEWASSGVNGDEKGFGSALTYGLRYFLLSYFNIPTDNDDPDVFQTKHMTSAEITELENKKINSIITQINEASTVDDLVRIKQEFIVFFDNDKIIKTSKEKYAQLTAQQPTAKVEEKAPEQVQEITQKAETEAKVKKAREVKKVEEKKATEVIDAIAEVEQSKEVVADVEEMAVEQEKANDDFIESLDKADINALLKLINGKEWESSQEFIKWATQSIKDLDKEPRLDEFKNECNKFYNQKWA